jgi:hypothetical protein
MDRSQTPVVRIGETRPARLFTEKGTAVASAIGGPLASTYLIAKNFRTLGKEDAARLTLIIGGAFTVALWTTLALIPSSVLDKIPEHLLPLIYGSLGYLVVKSLQQQDIDAHLQAGGKKGSWQMIVGTGLISIVLSLGYCFAVVALTPSRHQVFEGAPYKFEKSGCTMYYDKRNIPESDVKFVGALLEEMGYFSKDNPLPAGFRKEGSKYTIEMVLDEDRWDSPVVTDDVPHCLRILKDWHRDSEFQIRLVAIDPIGNRKTKVLQNSE